MFRKFIIHHSSFTRLQMPPPDSASTQSMRAGSASADGGQVIRNSAGFIQHHLSRIGALKKQIRLVASGAGFTLIELMVAIGITAVLGVLGIAGFVNYNQNQLLQTSANEVAVMLNLAKSRAQSQVKLGTSCSADTQILEGYKVIISPSSGSYTLKSRCSGVDSLLDTKILSRGVSFIGAIDKTIFFPVLTGGASPDTIQLSGFGRDKFIAINSLGGINLLAIAPTAIPTLTPTPTTAILPTSTSTPTLTPTPASSLVFVTSATYTGNLGGLTGADNQCQTLANGAGIGNTAGKTYKAWLSDSINSPSTRFVQSSSPYKLVNGTTVADDWNDLADGFLLNKINETENGAIITTLTNVRTNTSGGGTTYSTMGTCSNWTVAGATFAMTGAYTSTTTAWTVNSSIACNSTSVRLYCFEQPGVSPTSTPISTPTPTPTSAPTLTPTPTTAILPTSTSTPTPTPALTTVTIQGHHVNSLGADFSLAGQMVTLDTGAFDSRSPTWYFNVLSPSTYTATAALISGYDISYSLCVNCTDHTDAGGHPYVSGNVVSGINLPTPGNYADIYFKYTVPTPTSTPTPTLTPAPASKLVFVTSATYTGNLGGLTGADNQCQTLANGAGIGNTVGKTYKAWLSDSINSPSTRFAQSSIPYGLRDGTIIANNWTDLTDGALQNKINETESGTVITNNTYVWTNTNTNGTVYSATTNCNNWTSSGAIWVRYGTYTSTTSIWTLSTSTIACSGGNQRLYCFEQ